MTSNNQNKIVDHLFRQQYGKMVAIMTKIFGPSHLELIQDAIQDTFITASLQWRKEIPENPEAWLTMSAKNRVIDLIRQINAQKQRHEKTLHPSVALEIDEFFLDHEVQDSQLRMIFLACHPSFSKDEQIAFALQCISGFSLQEIAFALMQKKETIKKRLSRARKKIQQANIILEYPKANEISDRMSGVLQTIYLLFNEGFHSMKKDTLLDKEMCGEALRLCKNLMKKEKFRSGSLYSLFALFCYHSARIESKSKNGKIINLEDQNRSEWYGPLIELVHQAMMKSKEYNDHSIYHIEAAIAHEHIIAEEFDKTNWEKILRLYDDMQKLTPSDQILLSKASIHIYLDQCNEAKKILNIVNPDSLKSRAYLYHGTFAKLYKKEKQYKKALHEIEKAILLCSNELERDYLMLEKNKINSLAQ